MTTPETTTTTSTKVAAAGTADPTPERTSMPNVGVYAVLAALALAALELVILRLLPGDDDPRFGRTRR